MQGKEAEAVSEGVLRKSLGVLRVLAVQIPQQAAQCHRACRRHVQVAHFPGLELLLLWRREVPVVLVAVGVRRVVWVAKVARAETKVGSVRKVSKMSLERYPQSPA